MLGLRSSRLVWPTPAPSKAVVAEGGAPRLVELGDDVAEHERVVAEGDGDDGVVVAGPEEHHAGELVRVEVQDAGGGGSAITFTPER